MYNIALKSVLGIVKIDPSISWQYYENSDEKRFWISNEITKKYILFEDLSAQILNFLVNNNKCEDVINYANELNVIEELSEFIELLLKLKIIRVDNNEKTESNDSNIDNNDNWYDVSVENEMIEWIEKNNFLYSFHIDLTYTCNQMCVHCYYPEENNKLHSLNTEGLNACVLEKLFLARQQNLWLKSGSGNLPSS